MKYANYFLKSNYFNSLGDQIQILSIDYLYKCMGIPKSEIVYINKNDLWKYDGEPVILPVTMPLVEWRENGLAGMFSKQITPVYLGLTLAKDMLTPIEIKYLKKFAPVGCRDERTYNTMQKYGINSYVGGCITILLPQRRSKGSKVFIVEPPNELLPFIPNDIKENAVFCMHNLYGSCDDPLLLAKQQLEAYAADAKLVITSLLHSAMPCMAMGIPVILARNLVSYRFAWVEALHKIYTPDEYHLIDWNPTSIYYPEHKELVMRMVTKRLQGDYDESITKKVHSFYMNREKKNYVVDAFLPLKEFIDNNWKDKSGSYKYSIWGLTQMSELTFGYISQNYPNAELCHVYDNLKSGNFFGVKIEKSDQIINHKDETVFVTSEGATAAAVNFFEKISLPHNRFALLSKIQ